MKESGAWKNPEFGSTAHGFRSTGTVLGRRPGSVGCFSYSPAGADGFLTEGPGFNFFIVRDGTVASPDYNVLEGITRRVVREICEREGVPFELRKIRPEELDEANEVFTSATAGGVMPITGINGNPIGNGHAGNVTSRIQSTYWSERETGWHGVRAGYVLAG